MLSITSLLKTYEPQGAHANENGVHQYGYVYEFRGNKCHITFHVIRVNGMWFGASDCMCPEFGWGHPLMEDVDDPYPSLYELVYDLWSSAIKDLRSGFDFSPMGYANATITSAEKEMKQMLKLSNEEMLKKFKVQSFFML